MSVFRFKYFDVRQEKNPLKVGTDSMLLGALIEASGHKYALDLGTGTGVLSLMIAQKNPIITIDAIEIHDDGSQECRENFALSPWSDRLTVFKGDYFEFQFKGTYDLIFSNPPYHLDTLKSLDEDVSRAKHADPFLISEFFKRVDSLLTREGKFWIIFPFSGLNYLIKTGEEYNLFPTKIFFVHAKSSKPNKRVIICYQRNQINPVVKRDIIIRNENNQYTSEYKEITNTFHWEFMM